MEVSCRALLIFAILSVQCPRTRTKQQTLYRDIKPITYLVDSAGYDPKIPPKYDEDEPAEVTIQLVVVSIDSVNEASMDYSLTVYLRQFWVDERLKFTATTKHELELFYNSPNSSENLSTLTSMNSSSSNNNNNSARLNETIKNNGGVLGSQPYYHTHSRWELDSRAKAKVWFPDTYFVNERTAKVHDVTMPNELLHIFPNGTVFSSMRVSLTLTCHMQLEKYPFDEQDCPLAISSYGYTSQTVSYKWHEKDPVVTKSGMELPTFQLNDWIVVSCVDDEGSLGDFSCIQMHVSLSREYGYYIAQVYIPSILMVVLSWVNFWLDVNATPARISVGLLTVLTMTTMGVGAKNSLPRVSYVKAIDVWFSVCLVFVFAALLEFAFVNVTSRVQNRRMSMMDAVKMATEKNRADKVQKAASSFKNAASTVSGTSASSKPLTSTSRDRSGDRESGGSTNRFGCLGRKSTAFVSQKASREKARLVDKIARLIFPLSFIIFLIFYWCYYML